MSEKKEVNQKGNERRFDAPVVNANMRVRLPRADVDKNFLIASLENREGGRLIAFAERQIETCPEEVIGGEKNRQKLFERLKRRHPVDTVPHLIHMEPYLMLSNLTQGQLGELVPELRNSLTKANETSVFGALSTIQGIFIARASNEQE